MRSSVDGELSPFELNHLTIALPSELSDALEGRDSANMESIIERDWSYT